MRLDQSVLSEATGKWMPTIETCLVESIWNSVFAIKSRSMEIFTLSIGTTWDDQVSPLLYDLILLTRLKMVRRDPCLKYVCPVCEASPQERCHIKIGVLCFESHRERREFGNNSPSPQPAFPEVHRLPRRWQAS
jgi:hypothetical protein